MAYGQGNNGAAGKGFVRAGQTQRTAAPATRQGSANAATVKDGERLDKSGNTYLFAAFKNEGAGYSTTLKEDLVIPAGSKVAIFESTLKGKDGKTEYQVLNVKKMKPRQE